MQKAVRAIFGVTLAVVVAACGNDPTSADRDKAAFFQLDPTVATVNAGGTVKVAAVIVNKYGASTFGSVSGEPCDSKITAAKDTSRAVVQPPERFVITAGTTIGTSCLVVSSSGVTDTITVRVVPARLDLVADSTVGSGADLQLTTRFLTTTGATASGLSAANVTFTVSPSSAGTIDATGKFTAQAPGTATIIGTLKSGFGAIRADTVTLRIKEGPFTGTVAQSLVATRGGQILTFTAGTVPFDSDTKLTITGTVDSVTFLERTTTTIIAAVPYGKAAGTALKYTISNLGPNQLGVGGTFTTTAANLDDTWTGDDDPATAPATVLGQTFVGLIGATGADQLYKVVVTEAGTYKLQVDWSNGSDIDVYVTDAAYTRNLLARETSANPEVGTVSLQPGTYLIELYMYESAADSQTFRVRFTKQ